MARWRLLGVRGVAAVFGCDDLAGSSYDWFVLALCEHYGGDSGGKLGVSRLDLEYILAVSKNVLYGLS